VVFDSGNRKGHDDFLAAEKIAICFDKYALSLSKPFGIISNWSSGIEFISSKQTGDRMVFSGRKFGSRHFLAPCKLQRSTEFAFLNLSAISHLYRLVAIAKGEYDPLNYIGRED